MRVTDVETVENVVIIFNDTDVDSADVDPADVDSADVDPADVDSADVDPADVDPADVDSSDDMPEFSTSQEVGIFFILTEHFATSPPEFAQ
ncbi:hypothetical protein N7537_011418 [Penicillium hordei]|uniref:Uncharacterized protein n=1 Tax=Penicillium hordei TaxID=40994 RepID=A0AAD6DLQ8_9EURO|nr:uncharacterized protein N7537_011418 [Penicillium hordei]KAJ5588740.1 hypothetical protein N7537_011418 [Penicillium hordei]